MSIPYWPESLPVSYAPGLNETPMDMRAVFEPEVGEPLSRARATGTIQQINPTWRMNPSQVAAFKAFYGDTLAQGSRKFVMRDTLLDVPQWWRFNGPYQIDNVVRTFANVTAPVLVLPNSLWFADYVPFDSSVAPSFVADYFNGVYGIGERRVATSALPTIEGTYNVQITTLGVTTTEVMVLTAGDIPASAPPGVTLVIGYPV